MRILVVDDEGIVLNSCRRILEPEGYEVLTAASVNEALQIIDAQDRSVPFSMIIDVKMPVYDGMYLLQKLKEKKLDLPVVVMSGYPTEETIQAAADHGAVAFIAKPFTPDELLETVRSMERKGRKNE